MPYKNPSKKRENHKKYMREVWYPLNRTKHIKYIENLKRKISVFIMDYKKKGRCYDCGLRGKSYPEILEFDHLGDKKFNISEYRRITSSISKVQEEIEKCQLVCSNCHRIRTVKRKNCIVGVAQLVERGTHKPKVVGS